jgi:hypothetical protein
MDASIMTEECRKELEDLYIAFMQGEDLNKKTEEEVEAGAVSTWPSDDDMDEYIQARVDILTKYGYDVSFQASKALIIRRSSLPVWIQEEQKTTAENP